MDSQEIAALVEYGRSIAPISPDEIHGRFSQGEQVRFREGVIANRGSENPIDLSGKTGVIEVWHYENYTPGDDIMYHVQYGPDSFRDGICIKADRIERV